MANNAEILGKIYVVTITAFLLAIVPTLLLLVYERLTALAQIQPQRR